MSKRISTQELASELNTLKCENAAQHSALETKVSAVRAEAKEARKYFEQRLDRLDNRIWAVVLLTLGSLMASILSMLVI
jgi:outer membrane murein-binding lipoprotein Lpp